MKPLLFLALGLTTTLLVTACGEKKPNTQKNTETPWYAFAPLTPYYGDPSWMGLLFYTGGELTPYLYPSTSHPASIKESARPDTKRPANRDNGETEIYRDAAALDRKTPPATRAIKPVEAVPGPHQRPESSKAVHFMND